MLLFLACSFYKIFGLYGASVRTVVVVLVADVLVLEKKSKSVLTSLYDICMIPPKLLLL